MGEKKPDTDKDDGAAPPPGAVFGNGNAIDTCDYSKPLAQRFHTCTEENRRCAYWGEYREKCEKRWRRRYKVGENCEHNSDCISRECDTKWTGLGQKKCRGVALSYKEWCGQCNPHAK